ncbi:MAG: hypothetical protein H8E25_08010 [Planctomycetes bacterium]|nr:hypothetical protein [Planctomycetota bacterium]
MKSITLICFVSLLSLGSIAAQNYDLTELGTLSATIGDDVRSADINNFGFVHGDNDKTGPLYGTLQTRSYMWDGVSQIETFPSVLGSTWKGAMNDLGQCVGHQTVGSEFHGYLWDAINGTSDLDFGLRGFTKCYDINNSGVITGIFTSENLHNFRFQYRAFIYDSNTFRFLELPTLGGRESTSTAINNDNFIVGTTYDAAGTQHGFLWTPSQGMSAIPGLGHPIDINDNGVIVGYELDANGLAQAYRYDTVSQTLTSLPLPAGYTYGSANGINCFGQAVGYAVDQHGAQHALLWNDASSVTVLDTIINNLGSWEITGSNSINDLGEITGTGTVAGLRRAYKLSPVLVAPTISEFLPGRAGQNNSLFVLGFTPHQDVLLNYGGQGGSFVFHTIIASDRADADGRAEFNVSIPPSAANRTVWLNATELNLANPSVAILQLIN